MSEQPLVVVNHLKKYFDTPAGLLHAVDDVSFSIDKGKTLGVVGESGCGKSTLGRVIVRLLEATEGEILYDGEDVTRAKGKALKAQRRRMQMIFQDPFSSLNPRMTVYELIAEAVRIHGLYKGPQLSEKVKESMDLVGLAERFTNAYPHELDGGRRQRIGIARALILGPEFIVCDEPVSALDVSIQAQILNLMQDLQDSLGLSYMFITHDLSVVRHVSDEIVVMYLGVIVERCPSRDLFRTARHPYTKALLSAIPLPTLETQEDRILLKGEITSPIEPPDSCRFAPRCIYATDECFHRPPALESVGESHSVACHHFGASARQAEKARLSPVSVG